MLRSLLISGAAVLAAVGLRSLADPWVGDAVPFSTLFGAVAVVAWMAGWQAALACTVAGYLAIAFLFLPPRGSILLPDAGTAVGALLALLSCLIIIASAAAGRRARARAEAETRARTQAEGALAETADNLKRERERLAVALRAGGLGVYEWQVGADEVWWAPEVYRLYGVDPATFRPTVGALRELIHPGDLEAFWQKTQACIASHEPFAHEYRVIHPDGRVRWIFNRSHVGIGASGEVERITGVAVDVTERRQAEDDLRRLNQQLVEADRRKDEFVATLAHELRNPLAPIRNAVHVLKQPAATPAQARWGREVIDRQVGLMARLLEDLLDMSRITRGKLELRRSPVTLAEVVHSAIETSQPLVDAGGHALQVVLPQQPTWLDGDPVRLAQVFANLLNNAAKYTEAGGSIDLVATVEDGQVAVRVRDSGIGLAPDMIDRLFHMFSQATPARERTQGGLGIGLALARGLVELHGGTIEARSAGPRQGSEFVVRLPLAAPPPPAPSAPGDDAGEGLQGRSALVVDDNRDSADTLAMLLSVLGCRVRVAYGGEEALTTASADPPELVLLDLGMPGMDGLETCRRMRASDWGRRLLIVALTGWGHEDDRRRTREAGFDAHLVKPVDPKLVADLLAPDVPAAS
ncbi:MAG TPA: ATP-binding protein [Ramlibacter sp.]|nr:ATP-binding protein [Ramlibacter sp.]